MKASAAGNNGKRLITIWEVSALTGLSVSTLYTWVSQRKIPFVKLGRLLRFDTQAIDRWIRKNTVREGKFNDSAAG
jgi:excisionase family DNA binding protein